VPPGASSNLIVDSRGQPIGAQSITLHSIENQYELKAELGIPISDLLLRMRRSVGAAKSAAVAARSMQDAETQKVALDASLAYYNFLRAESSLQVSRRSLTRTRALLEDAKATTRVGVTTNLVVLRVDALVASTEVTVAEAERMRALTKRQLQILLDDDRLDPLVGEEIPTDPSTIDPISSEEASKRAQANRLELKALREAIVATQQREGAYQVARFPRLDGFGQAIQGRPNSAIFIPQDQWRTTWAVGMTLSYSPNETISNGAALAEARADHARLEAELETADRNIRLQTTAAVLDLNKAKTQIEAAMRAERAARDAYQAAQQLYRVGEATTTDLLDAETRLLGAELQSTHARLDLATAQVRLGHAMGVDLVGPQAKALAQ
jgi:outer membrane protein TolC